MPEVFLEACHAAITHRGVAHVSIPTDVSGRKLLLSPDRPIKAAVAGRISPVAADCGAALEMIASSEKVAILAGIGCWAQLAYPDHRAIAIVGDGAFSMLSGDLVTAVRCHLRIVIVVLNNAKLGFITARLGLARAMATTARGSITNSRSATPRS